VFSFSTINATASSQYVLPVNNGIEKQTLFEPDASQMSSIGDAAIKINQAAHSGIQSGPV
jgi:hypothetical protein